MYKIFVRMKEEPKKKLLTKLAKEKWLENLLGRFFSDLQEDAQCQTDVINVASLLEMMKGLEKDELAHLFRILMGNDLEEEIEQLKEDLADTKV